MNYRPSVGKTLLMDAEFMKPKRTIISLYRLFSHANVVLIF